MTIALSTALMLSAVTQDADMSATATKPRVDYSMMIRIERASSWLSRAAAAYDAVRTMGTYYPVVVESHERQFTEAVKDMEAALEEYHRG